MAVIADIVQDHQVEDTYGGALIASTYIVTDLSGSAPHEMLIDALNTPGVPQLGDAHPTLAHLVCNSRTGAPWNGCDRVLVNVTWGPRLRRNVFQQPLPPTDNNEAATREVSFATIRQRVDEDPWHGQDYKLTPPVALTGTFDFLPDQTAAVQIERSVMVFRFSRREKDVPIDRGIQYHGYVNSDSPNGRAPRTLKCLRINTTDQDQGGWSDTRYEIAYRPETWDEVFYWKSPAGVPAVAHDAGSRKELRIHPETLFAPLNLDFS